MVLEDKSWRDITLGEGMTPIVRFDDSVMLNHVINMGGINKYKGEQEQKR